MEDFNVGTNINRQEILQKLRNYFTILSSEYINIIACKYPDILKRALINFAILKILVRDSYLINYISLDYQKKLIFVIENYGKETINILKEQEYQIKELINFTTQLNKLSNNLKNSSGLSLEEDDIDDLKLVTDLAQKFVDYCYILISQNIENQDIICNLQGLAIILNIDNLPTEQQKPLLQQLSLIRELWLIDCNSIINEESVLLLFHTNILSIIKKENLTNHHSIFQRITSFLLDNYNVLIELTNDQLIFLYDRLKDLSIESQIINYILTKIYYESKFRDNHNKFNHSVYDLIKLFENYNVILHQIENTEFMIVEKFLINKNILMHTILINISKHIDFIRILNIAGDSDLSYLLNKIRKVLTVNFQTGHTISLMISAIESKLSSNIEAKIINRYFSLDNFTKNSLKIKYQSLFKNIISLLNKDSNYEEFIQQTITHKIVAAYKVNKDKISTEKLRLIEKERLEIARQLDEIKFTKLFSNNYLVKISHLNFKKYIQNATITTSYDFVSVIINGLLSNLVVEQLNSLLEFLKNDNLTEIKEIVKQELITQVKKRTTINKVIYYMVTGRKNELKTLSLIKKSLAEYL